MLTMVACVEKVEVDAGLGRPLFVFEARSPVDVLATGFRESEHFACLLAWDATSVSDEDVFRVVSHVLSAGAVYVCTWGGACQRVHDACDAAAVDLEAAGLGGVVMTTWHDDESLKDALDFLTTTAWPDDAFAETCAASVAISIGLPSGELRAAAAGLAAGRDEDA